MTSVQLIGGPTALIEWGGLRLLTDPTFSAVGVHESAPGRPLTKLEPPALLPDQVLPVDAVLLSHDQHADNLDPAGRQILASVPLVLTTPEAAVRLGGNARGLGTWQQTELSRPDGQSATITAVPARHGPPGCEPVTGTVTGFVLAAPDLPTVYISGDNASFDAVTQVAEQFGPVEVALLFAGAARTGLFGGAALTLTSADAARAAVILGACHVVAVHVRGWAHFSEGPDTVSSAFAHAGLANKLTNLVPGEKVHWPTDPNALPRSDSLHASPERLRQPCHTGTR